MDGAVEPPVGSNNPIGDRRPRPGAARSGDGGVVNEHHFDAMGCEIIVAADGPLPTDAIERLFRDRERSFSRFLPDSEINRVNARAGRVLSVSREFAHTLAVALQVAEETGGMVDPTIGGALEAAGYTRDFALLGPEAEPVGYRNPSVLVRRPIAFLYPTGSQA
jgi:thiamine biosynthesis lipoprotein